MDVDHDDQLGLDTRGNIIGLGANAPPIAAEPFPRVCHRR
jgi:hypothetical protein